MVTELLCFMVRLGGWWKLDVRQSLSMCAYAYKQGCAKTIYCETKLHFVTATP